PLARITPRQTVIARAAVAERTIGFISPSSENCIERLDGRRVVSVNRRTAPPKVAPLGPIAEISGAPGNGQAEDGEGEQQGARGPGRKGVKASRGFEQQRSKAQGAGEPVLATG